MAVPGTKANEIAFFQNGDDVTVKANGVSVEIHADGSILAHTNSSVKTCLPANDAAEPKPGAKMPDGTVYAGISPDTGEAMYTMPADVRKTAGRTRLFFSFNEAKECSQGASAVKAYGHQDWRIPTKPELNVLFNNRAAIGGFTVTGSPPAGWYWSSTQDTKWHARGQRFSDGAQLYNGKDVHSSVRCVR